MLIYMGWFAYLIYTQFITILHIYKIIQHTHTCVYMYIYIYIYMYVCIYIYMSIHIYMSIYIHTYTYIYIHVCIYIYIYIHVCIYIYIYIHIHIYIYMLYTHLRIETTCFQVFGAPRIDGAPHTLDRTDDGFLKKLTSFTQGNSVARRGNKSHYWALSSSAAMGRTEATGKGTVPTSTDRSKNCEENNEWKIFSKCNIYQDYCSNMISWDILRYLEISWDWCWNDDRQWQTAERDVVFLWIIPYPMVSHRFWRSFQLNCQTTGPAKSAPESAVEPSRRDLCDQNRAAIRATELSSAILKTWSCWFCGWFFTDLAMNSTNPLGNLSGFYLGEPLESEENQRTWGVRTGFRLLDALGISCNRKRNWNRSLEQNYSKWPVIHQWYIWNDRLIKVA